MVGVVEQILIELGAAADPPGVFVRDHHGVVSGLAVEVEHRVEVVLRPGHKGVAIGHGKRDHPERLAVQHGFAPFDPDLAETEPARERVLDLPAAFRQRNLRPVEERIVGFPEMRIPPRKGNMEGLKRLPGKRQFSREPLRRRVSLLRKNLELRGDGLFFPLRVGDPEFEGDFALPRTGCKKEIVDPQPGGTPDEAHVLSDAAQGGFLLHRGGHFGAHVHFLLDAGRGIDPDQQEVLLSRAHPGGDVP